MTEPQSLTKLIGLLGATQTNIKSSGSTLSEQTVIGAFRLALQVREELAAQNEGNENA